METRLSAALNWLFGCGAHHSRAPRSSLAALDFPSRARPHLLLRFLLADFSNQRTHRPQRDSSRHRLPAGGGCGGTRRAILVRALAVLAFSSDHALMLVCWVGPHRLAAGRRQRLAAADTGDLLCLLSVLRERGQDFSSYQSDGMLLEAGFISLFFAPPGIRPALGRTIRPRAPAISSAVGMVSHLFRIGRREACQRRSVVAPFHGHGRLLPEWSAAQLDRMVRAAFAALVSRRHRFLHLCCWNWGSVADVSSAPLSHRSFLHPHPFQIGIILTANYAFLNYIVLSLGIPAAGRPRSSRWILPRKAFCACRRIAVADLPKTSPRRFAGSHSAVDNRRELRSTIGERERLENLRRATAPFRILIAPSASDSFSTSPPTELLLIFVRDIPLPRIPFASWNRFASPISTAFSPS